MKTENREIMKQARESLSGKWGLAVGTFLVYFIISIALGSIPKTGGLLSLLIAGAFSLGVSIFSLAFSRNQNPNFNMIFEGFKRFGTALLTHILFVVFIMLWSLLLIIPGIIASYSYAMTFFILADDHSISPREAIRKSKKMMHGNKWKLFRLHWRFFGWVLLCVLTLGIGCLWLMPYIQVSLAKFYDDIKNQSTESAVTA